MLKKLALTEKKVCPMEKENVAAEKVVTPANCSAYTIDLNNALVTNKEATFFFKMNSNAMAGAGIFKGDILVVDRSITEANGKVVIAVLDGDMIVRRLQRTPSRIRLIPETHNLAAIDIELSASFSVWGVVLYAIHAV